MVISNEYLHMLDDIKNIVNAKSVDKLYKFISFNQDKDLNNKKIDTFIHNSLYMSSPLYFNDPYDCELSFNLLEGYEDFLKIGLNREQRRGIKHNKRLREEARQETEGLQKELESEWMSFKKEIAVCCFTEELDNFLMWSHYANCYNGICLEYNVEEIKKMKYFLSPIKYTNKLIRARDYINKEDFKRNSSNRLLKAAIVSVLSKQSQWEYENEWRIVNILNENNSSLIQMPTPKKVYIGFKVDNSIKEKIIGSCKKLKIENVYETRISTNEYKLVHNPIEITIL